MASKWLWVSLLMLASLTTGHVAGSGLDELETRTCQRVYVRKPSNLKLLKGCKVIEGSLNFALAYASSPKEWAKYSFPELREITGYLFLYDIGNLTSMRGLFPNLMVIRGQELIDTHAMVISIGNELQEVGLPSLTDIQKGSVWITDNSQLCYVNTIDWGLITNESSVEGISKNRPIEQCPNACQKTCPKSKINGRHLCWGSRDCQKVHSQLCPMCDNGPCTARGECCSSQCLGGCSGTSAKDCFVCKRVLFNGTCSEQCPPHLYEYIERRCVTRENCLAIQAFPDLHKSKGSRALLKGKVYEDYLGKKLCVLDCPKGTELAPNQIACIPCILCKKICQGKVVDSIERARELRGCTKIEGALKISIRRGSGISSATVLKELKENLDKIEEIDHHLVITHTHVIVSLDFLENLKVIRGRVLESGRYALVVRSNENLMKLWSDSFESRNVTIQNVNASVLFHYNPRLCPQKIWGFVAQSGIHQPKDDKQEIGITNGDKVTCNTEVLELEILTEHNNSVRIRYGNFRRNLTLTSHLLGYEIHYKEAPNYPHKNVSKYDDRDPCGKDDWTILEHPKIGDSEVDGALENEPKWEIPRYIPGLKPYTWYALYVKTVVIPDANSLNNNTGAESNLIHFRTLPGVPTEPTGLSLRAGGPDTITLSWALPSHPNGELESFQIYLKEDREDQTVHDQRNYCVEGRTPKIPMEKASPDIFGGSVPVTPSSKLRGSDCCSCSAPVEKDTAGVSAYDAIRYQDGMMHQLMDYAYVSTQGATYQGQGNRTVLRRRKRSLHTVIVENSYHASLLELKETVRVKDESFRYTFTLTNLSHFTTYEVGIKACRSVSRPMINDTRLCSDLISDWIQTEPSVAADNIDPSTISVSNVTSGESLHLSWAQPPNPNGAILGYQVKVQPLEGQGSKYPKKYCLTRKEFQSMKNNYTVPEALQPGKYSVSIQVASLARDSEWTVDHYFVVEDKGGDDDWWVRWVILGTIVTAMVIIAGGFLSYFYYPASKPLLDWVGSFNPVYFDMPRVPSEWEVPSDKLTLFDEKELGKGSFGRVVEGLLVDFIDGKTSVPCAVKLVAENVPVEYRALFLKEASLMVKLDCRCHHVVRLLGVISKSAPTCVIMEKMDNGDLRKYLRSRRPENGMTPPTLREVLRMAAEICDGMAYIHKHKLLHRDLAARNCMVGGDLVVKVGDFGMSREVTQSDYYLVRKRALLPIFWMAPESIQDGLFTTHSDVWSFGVVLWEIATMACRPYLGLSQPQVLEYVLSGGTMARPGNCPLILYQLMRSCWEFEARERPNFIQLLDRLAPSLEPSFGQVSFYGSAEGRLFRQELENMEEDEGIVDDALKPLAEFKHDLDAYDLDDDQKADALDLNVHHIIDDLGELVVSPYPSIANATTVPVTVPVLQPIVTHPKSVIDLSARDSSYESGSSSSVSSSGSDRIPNGDGDSFMSIPFHHRHHHHHPTMGGITETSCRGSNGMNGFVSRRFPPINETSPVNRTTEC